MIIYKNSLSGFYEDNGKDIIDIVKKKMGTFHIDYTDEIRKNSSEEKSWGSSFDSIEKVLRRTGLPDDTCVFIEYNVPFTSSRIDFGITGLNEDNINSAMIIEMKSWSRDVELSDSEGMVHVKFYGGRDVLHPSYQAMSYANYLSYFNSEVVDGQVKVVPCSFLYNFCRNDGAKIIEDPRYGYYTNKAKVFYREDTSSLSDYIDRHIKKSDGYDTLEKIENGKLTVSASLQKSLRRILHDKDFFAPMDNQVGVYGKLFTGITDSHRRRVKKVFIVRGGPGTGKSVLALKLLSGLIAGYEDKYTGNHIMVTALYVTKTQAPRKVYSKELTRLSKEVGTELLFRSASSFVDCDRNEYPAIIVDEAHRLAKRSSQYSKGENQIKEIINAGMSTVFFIDEDQNVSMNDIGTIDEIEHWANEYGAEIITDGLSLQTQFRCKGSGLYIAWVDDVLEIRKSDNLGLLERLPYDISIAETPEDFMKKLNEKKISGYETRELAGYCWKWNSKERRCETDIKLDGVDAKKWNTNYTWASDAKYADEVGCIHTVQGMEFQYVGVIIGEDLVYRNGSVIALPEKNRDTGSMKGWKKNPARAERMIKNTYRTLMTRGMDGCVIYCVDREMSEYMKRRIEEIRNL